MKCSIKGCPGEYDSRRIIHTVRRKGEVLVFENVPADVCTVCSDTLLTPTTVERIQEMMNAAKPERTAPLYAYA